MEAGKKGIITPEMEIVAKKENVDVNQLREWVASGQVCIPANIYHKALSPEGIGTGLRTKINGNLCISGDCKTTTLKCKKSKWLSILNAKLLWI